MASKSGGLDKSQAPPAGARVASKSAGRLALKVPRGARSHAWRRSKNTNLGFEGLHQADRAWIEHFQPQSPVHY